MKNIIKDKLRYKPELRATIVNIPYGYEKAIGIKSQASGKPDFLLHFVRTCDEVTKQIPKSLQKLSPSGILWVAYPKSTSNIETDLSRDKCRSCLKPFGYAAVSLVSIDDSWAAMRFKPATEVKSKKAESPLVDTVKRIVKAPEDLKARFSKNKKAETFFNTLSFTHKKEYVLWIESAKKKETTEARISKTVEMLSRGIKSR